MTSILLAFRRLCIAQLVTLKVSLKFDPILERGGSLIRLSIHAAKVLLDLYLWPVNFVVHLT